MKIVKVLLVTDTYPPDMNGVAHHTKILAEELAKKNIEVAVATMDDKEEIVFENDYFVYKKKGHTLKMYPEINYTVKPPIKWLKKVALDFKPDVIHAHSPSSLGIAAYYVARELNIPIIGTFHTHLSAFGKTTINSVSRIKNMLAFLKSKTIKAALNKLNDSLVRKWVIEYYDAMDLAVAPSQKMKNYLLSEGIKENKVKVIENFIDLHIGEHISGKDFRDKFGIDQNKKLILYVGRLSWEKRVWVVLDIAERLPEYEFAIAGRGPISDWLQEEIEKRNLNNVKLTGYLDYYNLYGAYDAADLIIAPSTGETFNLSAAQGMLFGKPIIAKEGAVVEYAQNNVNGYLLSDNVEGEKEINWFVEKAREILENKELYAKFSKNSKEISKRYTRKQVINKLIRTYADVYSDWSLGKRPSIGLKLKATAAFSLVYLLGL